MESFSFQTALWRHPGKGGWHFVTLPADVAEAIRFFRPSRGFMPIPVHVTLRDTTWKTSVFPDTASGSFLLAVKAEVRKAQAIGHGDVVAVALRLA